MPNIMDYLDWRGDLPMTHSPFNEVDNLILAQLSYLNFEQIVPGIESKESISIKAASDLFFTGHDEVKIASEPTLIRVSAVLLKKMSQCDRFAQVKLSKFVNRIDYDEQKQFSAINYSLEDGTVYVAYRGTDETIVGWKEDFNMTFMTTIPAQMEAVQYLTETAGRENKKIRIGGHSKGGNLAVYAAVKCNHFIKDKIIEVYNNDGPGFNKEMITSKEYREMRSRIKTIVPQTSIVGMLLEHEEEYSVVESKQKHIMQHFTMSWEVLGNKFVYVDGVTEESKRMEAILKSWVNNMDIIERERFVDSLFYILESSDVKNARDLAKDKWRKIAAMRKIISSMPVENREALFKTIRLFISEGTRVVRERNKQSETSEASKSDLMRSIRNMPLLKSSRTKKGVS